LVKQAVLTLSQRLARLSEAQSLRSPRFRPRIDHDLPRLFATNVDKLRADGNAPEVIETGDIRTRPRLLP
jgi:hypothetical protein